MIINAKNYANYGIITDGSKPLAFAQKELSEFVKRCCGFELGSYNAQPQYISLGVNEKSSALIAQYDLESLNEDGFYLVQKDGNLYIFGATDKGVLFGVYELLERCLGVRFLNSDCEYTPKNEALEFSETELKRVPYTKQRLYLACSMFYKPLPSLRYKFTGDYAIELEEEGFKNKWYKGIPTSHNSNYYVPYEEYNETNPEFFNTYKYGNFRIFDAAVELCYTNGVTEDGEFDESKERSVVSVTVDSLMKYMEDEPHAEFFMFGRVDNAAARCHCAKCEKARSEYGDSGIMMVFMNTVIQQARKRCAEQGKTFDKKLVTFAYSATVNPPVKDGKPISPKVVPDKDVYVRYAPIDADYTYALNDPRQKETTLKQIEGWSLLTKNLMVWDYNVNYNDYFWFFPSLSYIKQNLQLYYDMGMTYIMMQGANNVPAIWQDDLKCYVASRLFWDMSLEVEDLVKEYVNIYYGLGAENVLEFLRRMENHYAEKIAGGFHTTLGSEKEFFDAANYPLELLQGCEKLLDEALEKVQNSELSDAEKQVYTKRLKAVLLTPLRMIVRNEHAYFGGENLAYEEKFYKTADAVGVKRTGEVVPIYIDFVSSTEDRYKLITGQNPTEKELAAAKYIQDYVYEKTGRLVPIKKDDAVFPAYWERGIMVGKNTMTNEFYKGGLDLSGYSYFVDIKGWCVFIDSEYDIMKSAEVFVQEFLRKGDEENSLEIISKKRVGLLG
ncbi:MAG: DUF4838 domain-containing protein [Clostridia bacterium]|nr:DUF4838 domain-containing protein [Clostridia bacterium]